MEVDDEVYSDLDFQEEEQKANAAAGAAAESRKKQEDQEKDASDEYDDDEYMDDEFELVEPQKQEAADEEAKKKPGNAVKEAPQLVERNVVTPDLGNVAKVAKKEGVLEVVEADDGHEKALSSGSAFSEISVKDEENKAAEEDRVGGNGQQILLDDQSADQAQNQRHAQGAVKQPQKGQHLQTVKAQVAKPIPSLHLQPQSNIEETKDDRDGNHQIDQATGAPSQPPQIAQQEARGDIQLSVSAADQHAAAPKIVGVVTSSEDGDNNQDMFSPDFQIPSAGQTSQKQGNEPSSVVTTSLNNGEMVAASSGAMPETFRDDSQSSSNSQQLRKQSEKQDSQAGLPPKTGAKTATGVSKTQQWERRQQKGLRAPRAANLSSSNNNSQGLFGATSSTQQQQPGKLRPKNQQQQQNQQDPYRRTQLSLNRQESEQTYGTQSLGGGAEQQNKSATQTIGNRTAKAADSRPPWGGSGLRISQNPSGTIPGKTRLQTAITQPTPSYPLRPLKTPAGCGPKQQNFIDGGSTNNRQNAAYEKFVNRGSKSSVRNGQTFPNRKPSQNTVMVASTTKNTTSKFISVNHHGSLSMKQNSIQQAKNFSKSVRPNTSVTNNKLGCSLSQSTGSNLAGGSNTLPRNIHPGSSYMQTRDQKSRHFLQSATTTNATNYQAIGNSNTKQTQPPRLSAQRSQQYGGYGSFSKPTSTISSSSAAMQQQQQRRTSAATRVNQFDERTKKLRSGNQLMSSKNSASVGSAKKFIPTSSVGFQRQASASREKKTLAMGKSPMRDTMSASRLNQSRASLGETSFHGMTQYPTIDFKGDEDFAIKILDNMIQVEEEMGGGFSMYNRGKNLKKSLINPDRVKEYLQKVEKEKSAVKKPEQLIALEDQSEEVDFSKINELMMLATAKKPQMPKAIPIRKEEPDLSLLLEDNHIDEDKQWRLMLDYFKKNPTALMDAIPTPPDKEQDEEALRDFRTGLTPKRGCNFKFGGDGVSSVGGRPGRYGGQNTSHNRPNYNAATRSSLAGNAGLNRSMSSSQMSATRRRDSIQSASRQSRIYQQSPRIGSARSNRLSESRLSQSATRSRPMHNSSIQRGLKNIGAPNGSKNLRNSSQSLNQSFTSVDSSSKRLYGNTSSARKASYYGSTGPNRQSQASATRRQNNNTQSSSSFQRNATQQHQSQLSQASKQRDFRISTRSSRTGIKPVASNANAANKQRLQAKKEEEQKNILQKRQHTDRVKNLLKKNPNNNSSTQQQDNTASSSKKAAASSTQNIYGNSNSNQVQQLAQPRKSAVMHSGSKPSLMSHDASSSHFTGSKRPAGQAAAADKTVLDYIDWKESYCYKQLIVRQVEDGLKWDKANLLQEDEADLFSKLIRGYKSRRAGFKPDELLRMTPSITKKCYASIEAIYKEFLTESYSHLEYDRMRANDPYVCTQPPRGFTTQALKILTLENLLERVSALKNFKKETKTFLELIHQRELVLKQMQIAVESIQSDAFFISKEDLEQRKAYSQEEDKTKLQEEVDAQMNPRTEILNMGNNLVDLTDQIIKGVLKFFRTFNKQFTYVKLETFIFQEADYLDVILKEVQEIDEIFNSYEIHLNRLHNLHLVQDKVAQQQAQLVGPGPTSSTLKAPASNTVNK